MDSEKGEGQIPRMSGDSKKKRSPFFVKLLVAFVIIICAIPVMFGMGVVGAVYGMFLELVVATTCDKLTR